MTPEGFGKIEKLYHAIRECSPDERAALLGQADPELRREVESLLREPSGGEFLDRPAFHFDGRMTGVMPISPGDKLGPYEIVAPLGEGGMGQVWKARDTRLNRIVAIKTSHKRFNERFEREARAIAALNHPHVCQLYDVGPDYLVMEYVEGKPLQGPLPPEQALMLAGQILDALDAAHRKGITHRDLKPGNILAGKAGVKVLDFGLAKIEREKVPDGATETMPLPLTSEGTILGTLQYMSPEQIEGQEADARSDIFAFGLVLYEMLTGQRAFTGKSRTSLVAAILKDQPRPVSQLKPLTPPALERVIQTCLEKDPDKRWQSATDVKHALDLIETGAPAPPRAKKSWMWPAIASGLAVIAAVAWALWPKPQTPARSTHFQVTLPENVEFSQYVSVSPDGHKLVFNATGAQSGLWVHDLNTLEWNKLAGTEGAVSPFWSPDSRFLGFAVGNELKKIDVAGGPPQTLCTAPQAGTGSWSPDGVIVFGGRATGSLRRVSASGGAPTDVTALDPSRGEAYHSLPTFLPDGKHFVYLRGGVPEIAGIYVGSLDAKPAEQSRERILATRFAAPYVGANLFFMRENTLMTQPFDVRKLRLSGEPIPVAEHIGTTGAIGIFSVSSTGVLAYRTGGPAVAAYQPTWFDRQGKTNGTFGVPGPDQGLALSPDATRAAGRDAVIAASGDIWMLDFARGVRTRLTFHQAAGSFPVWSPDGSRIAFSDGNSRDTIYEKAAGGAGEEKELLKRPGESKVPTSWSRDGRFLLYHTLTVPNTGDDLWVLPLEGDRKPVLLLGTDFYEGLGSFSPDGRWIAYESNESGRPEVYVRPFISSGPSGPALGEGKWQVSKDGVGGGLEGQGLTGGQPKWRGDGKEIFFRAPNGSPMAVEVNGSGARFQVGVPKQLFAAPANESWDVTADGKKFIMLVSPLQGNTQTSITVVLNWQADLKR
jgi:eukaryotic-like serine/threonine-protein kinase